MRCALKFILFIGAVAVLFDANSSLRGASVLSYHNDSSSTGVNASETILTPANLTVINFGKRYAVPVDGQIYAQPLYLPGVVVSGGAQAGTHDLVFVATQHDSVYAIDADSGVIVWQTSFLASGLPGATAITSVPSVDTGAADTYPEIGVCSTPVIYVNGSTKLLYVAAKTKQILNGVTALPNYVYTLYVIDITNGNATPNANIVNSMVVGDTAYDGSTYTYRTDTDPSAPQDPFVFGTGDGAIMVNGQSRVYFNALRQMNRPGLILANGSVYISFASHGDIGPYHGWTLGYDMNTLAPTAAFNFTPNGEEGGLWGSGAITDVDASGNFYTMTGNGTFDGYPSGGGVAGLTSQGFPVNGNYGDCFVKLAIDSSTSAAVQNINGWGLKVLDYFSPFNNAALNSGDVDLSSGGCTLLPDSAGSGDHPHLMVGAGKQGNIYLIDCDSMGKFSAARDNVVQSQVALNGSFDTPAFFNGQLYYVGVGEGKGATDHGKAFTVANAVMSTKPVLTPDKFEWPGSTPSISANGTTNGVVWTLDRNSAELRAYSADNFHTELWTSALAPANRDQLGTVTKFATPTVADGRVLVGTTTALVVYSVLPPTPLPFATTLVAQEAGAAPGVNGATFASFGNPAVNENDGAAFAGTLATGAGGVTKSNDLGVWADDNTGTLSLIAQAGSGAAPGTTANFLTFSDPVYNNSEAVAFRATLKVATGQAASTTATGVWATTGSPDSLALVAQQGGAALGANGGTFKAFTSLGLTDSGNAVLYATLNTNKAAGVATANDAGIWEGSAPGNLTLLLRLGGIVVGKTISKLTFLPTETYVNGQTRGFNSTSGDIVCGAAFSDKTTGIIEVAAGTPSLAEVSGGPATGGATFASFGSPAINTSDDLAFAATLATGAGGVTTSNDLGVWAVDNTGTLSLIAQSGSPALGTSANFLTFSDPVYNNNEAVAFRATLKVASGQATSTTATGIWATNGSPASLALVARQGVTQAPGCPAGATFSGFTELALADQGGATNKGGVIMLATLNTNSAAGVGKTNNLGIWAVDTTGALQLIVRTGDTLNDGTADSPNAKTVTGLAFLPAETYVNGQGRSFAQDTGDLVYLATFSDKSTAIFNVVFP